MNYNFEALNIIRTPIGKEKYSFLCLNVVEYYSSSSQ